MSLQSTIKTIIDTALSNPNTAEVDVNHRLQALAERAEVQLRAMKIIQTTAFSTLPFGCNPRLQQ
ncbi:hypothetical protein ABIC83_002410 [Roseateles asaccharophilus]|uniref:hypothetical protein n=1 Tax=Roseateles asaccharophilus TaxID=582607 RepID=UPI00383299DD